MRLLAMLFGCALFTGCTLNAAKEAAPVTVEDTKSHIIFDTDMAPDYDDVGALALLHALADFGETEILATVSSNKCETTVPCLEVINTYFGRPDIPVGCVKGEAHDQSTWHEGLRWTEELPKNYPHTTEKASDSRDALEVYREVLSKQPDKSVTLIVVGMLTNMRNLLQSKADEYSDLDGVDLIKQKVDHVVCMGGSYPDGREFNIYCDSTAAVTAINEWPTPIYFSTWEIGDAVRTGKRLAQSGIKGNPIVDTFTMCLAQDDPEGHSSWDQTAALVGAIGVEPFFKAVPGTFIIADDGSNKWEMSDTGKHYHLEFNRSKEEVTNYIETLMMYQPRK
ncbi:MAG: nucleoside hydrolase [Prevotellaceae bacterium]|nr:nucleoside hydrolase [Prevotellaceae bacterium]